MAATNSNAINYFSPAKWVVSTVAGEGTHTTIAGALGAASSGDTIIILPGTYSESNTVGMNINICGHTGDSNDQVIVDGTFTVTGAYTVNLSNLYLETPATTYFLAVTGSAASVVNLTNCYLDCSVATGIDYTSSSASSAININQCTGNLGTTGIGLYTMSSTGTLSISYTYISNSGASTTASSNSKGTVAYVFSTIDFACSTSSTGAIDFYYANFQTSAINTTSITSAGTGSIGLWYCFLSSGSAAGISVGTGTTCDVYFTQITSTATDAISGAGTCNYAGMIYGITNSYTIATTTSGGGTIQGIRTGVAPSAGFIGEHIQATFSGTSLGGSSNPPGTGTNLTSLSLTAGIWDLSAGCLFNPGSGSSSNCYLGINAATGTLQAADANGCFQCSPGPVTGASSSSISIPAYRVTISSTTSYYLNAEALYTGTAVTCTGRFSAVRVG